MKGFIQLIIVIAVLGGIWFAWEQWKGNEAIQVDYQTEPLETVSYTHLDVYKRQVLGSVDIVIKIIDELDRG